MFEDVFPSLCFLPAEPKGHEVLAKSKTEG